MSQGESKVAKYAELVESFYEIKRLNYRMTQQQAKEQEAHLTTDGHSNDDATQIHGGEPESIVDDAGNR